MKVTAPPRKFTGNRQFPKRFSPSAWQSSDHTLPPTTPPKQESRKPSGAWSNGGMINTL
jgi:hypothetical protein